MEGTVQRTLGLADYLVIFATLLVSASIGLYFRLSGGRQKTTKEYLLGNRDQSMFPVAFSLMASFMSAITLLGVSSEVYMYGIIFFVINFGYLFFAPLAIYFYLPVFFKLETTSAYEYLNLRFGAKTRTCASLMFLLQMVFYMGIVVYAPALALEALTGLSQELSVVLVGFVCMFYSTLGGMKAVIWTDVFQSLLMFAAVLSVIFAAALEKGGLQAIWQIAADGGRINFNNTLVVAGFVVCGIVNGAFAWGLSYAMHRTHLDPTIRHTYPSLLVGGGFTFMSLYAVNQTQVQRYLTMKDLKTAVRSLWLSNVILLLLSGLTCFAGLAIYSKYYSCDPVLAGRIDRRDQLLPLFVVETMGNIPGLSGLFVAGIFSASLSTLSACFNSLAAVTLEDYIKPLYLLWTDTEISAVRCALISKLLALTYGLVCLGMAFLSHLLGGVLQAALSIFGMVGGPIFGVFSLGLFFPIANESGALMGLLMGLAVALVMGFGGPKPPNIPLPLNTDNCPATPLLVSLAYNVTSPAQSTEYFYLFRVSYLYYIVISFGVTLLVGLAVSGLASLWSQPSKDLNPDLFSPPVANYLREKRLKRELQLNSQGKQGNVIHGFSVHL